MPLLLLWKLNHTFLLGGLSESEASSSSSSSSSSLCFAATGCFEHVELANGGVGGPVAEGFGAILVSMAMRYESMSSFMKSSGGGGGGVRALRGGGMQKYDMNEEVREETKFFILIFTKDHLQVNQFRIQNFRLIPDPLHSIYKLNSVTFSLSFSCSCLPFQCYINSSEQSNAIQYSSSAMKEGDSFYIKLYGYY